MPTPFFVRLIWQESRFNPEARSPAGAQGVAQFMPATAAERGAFDPFEPARALDESAAYLKELRQRFGNLGLAAAAYNAGPGRVGRWLAGTASLPTETINYVDTVTGHAAFEWRGPFVGEAKPPALDPEPGFSCVAFAGDAGRRLAPITADPDDPAGPKPKPWAMILVASFNKAAVLAEWQIVRARYAETLSALTPSVRRRHLGGLPRKKYSVQIEADTRSASTQLCKQLERQGGNCVVLRNVLR
ncbi:lytic transglycosylase domain-containing protein [Beijerinckia sp. L45]|uniref:lytic transglycosylase domain-containing protein n=1 Tax=Beijerinckia sp. L45 TaxID=1641855 RepID=UPI00131DA58A|nr:lytic transglycosylase domain-containing protein [Beijerinckia sp. L45]